MAAQQRRLITAANSKLGKLDVTAILRNDLAWVLLPLETRKQLYALLPATTADEPPHDADVHPLSGQSKYHVEAELRRWQADLVDGKETKKWREVAMQASRDREAGVFEEWNEARRIDQFGDQKSIVKDGSGSAPMRDQIEAKNVVKEKDVARSEDAFNDKPPGNEQQTPDDGNQAANSDDKAYNQPSTTEAHDFEDDKKDTNVGLENATKN